MSTHHAWSGQQNAIFAFFVDANGHLIRAKQALTFVGQGYGAEAYTMASDYATAGVIDG